MTSDDKAAIPDPASGIRFEATVHPGERQENLEVVPGLDLDPIPDPAGQLRVLIDAADAARLVQLGFEVRLLRSQPINPLDGALVADDEAAMGWLEERVVAVDQAGIERQEAE